MRAPTPASRHALLSVALLALALLLASCTASSSDPEPVAPEATPTLARVVEPRPQPPALLEPGESAQLTAVPYDGASFERVTEPLGDGELDDMRATLLYDRETGELYRLDGVWGFCFLQGRPGGRLTALATNGVHADFADERSVLVQFDPIEFLELPLRLNTYCRERPATPIRHEGVEVGICCLNLRPTVDARRLPDGFYDFNAASLRLTLVHPVLRQGPDGPVERWTIDGQSLDLTREAGILRLGRMVDAVQAYRLSPDGRLLALSGRHDERRGLHLVPLASGSVTTVAFDLPLGFAFDWSPDSRWLYTWWPDPVDGRTGATHVIEIVKRETPGTWYERGELTGPLQDRVPLGWFEREPGGAPLLLLRSTGYPERVLEVLDPATGTTTTFAQIGGLLTYAVDPHAEVIATSAWSESLALYRLSDGTRHIPAPLDGVELGILDLSWSEDGRWIAAYRADGRS